MNSIIFDVLVRILKPFLWVLALWLLLRGHNAPGGGFVAGLVAASTILLQALSTGWSSINSNHRKNLFMIAGIGLSVCVMSGLFALTIGNPYLTGRWLHFKYFDVGTPMLFDVGVFIIVYAVVVICTGYLLAEDDEEGSIN